MRYSSEISKKYGSMDPISSSSGNLIDEVRVSSKKPEEIIWPFTSSTGTDNPATFGLPKNSTAHWSTPVAMPQSVSSFPGFSASSNGTNDIAPVLAQAPKSVSMMNWELPGLRSGAITTSLPSSSLPQSAFSFSGGNTITPTAPFGGFLAGGFGGSSVHMSATDVTKVNDDEEEGEPIMEAEKALRNEDDKDDILCDCPCKLLRFDSDKGDGGKGEWTDVGKGIFRVTKCPESNKQRMLVRNTVGRITFNAAFYRGMKITRYSKVMLSFGVVVDPSGPLRNFLLKLKDTDIDSVCTIMEAAIKALT